MAENSLIKASDLEKMPADARRKWLQARRQELKSTCFGLKQQLEKFEQDIEDIREGKMNKVKYSFIMTMEQLKTIEQELNTVDLT